MTAKRTSIITLIAGMLLIVAFIFHFIGLEILKQTVLIIGTFIAGYPISKKAFQAIRMKAFSIELLVTIAVIGALLIGEYVESAAVTFLFLFGAFLEARTLEKTRSSLNTLIDLTPDQATIIQDGTTRTVPIEDVDLHDNILVRSGEKIAVDGWISNGTATLYEAAITGESTPSAKKIGDYVYSGTIVDHGSIEVIAEKVGEDTTFSKIIELVEEAQETKSNTEKFLDRFAAIYTPAILILSILVYIFTQNIHMALTFLVVACPGALVLSAPVSLVAGIGNGARHGVLIKGGETMERLAKVDTVVFDKTGTLTQGHPTVTNIYTRTMKASELLRVVAEVEMHSEHHLGQTIVKEAKKENLSLAHDASDVNIIKGRGMTGYIDEKFVVIGNRTLMQEYTITVPFTDESHAVTQEKDGNTAVFVGMNGELAGIISIADEVRLEAKQAIADLKVNGVKNIVMLTGDNAHTAALVGKQLEIDEVHAELLPVDKVKHINRLKESGGTVAMIGDGINDAPAIANADIGLAMGIGGTDISMETADVVLMNDRLDYFSHAFTLAKATFLNMKQNTIFAVSTVLLLLIGVLFGKIFLTSGMLIHELSIILVVLNALRLVKYKSPSHKKNQTEEEIIGESATCNT